MAELQGVLDEYPDVRELCAEATLAMGRVFCALPGDHRRAVEALRRVAEQFPEIRRSCAMALWSLASVHLHAGEDDECMACCRRVVEDYHDVGLNRAKTLCLMGRALLGQGKWTEAMGHLEQVLAEYGGRFLLCRTALRLMAVAHALRDDRQAVGEALKRFPDYRSAPSHGDRPEGYDLEPTVIPWAPPGRGDDDFDTALRAYARGDDAAAVRHLHDYSRLLAKYGGPVHSFRYLGADLLLEHLTGRAK